MKRSYLSFYRLGSLLLISCLFGFISCGQKEESPELEIEFDGKHGAQIEVGSPYAGIEIHHSSPMLNRISFFYPKANSLDLSEDYWKRDQSHILFLGIKDGENPGKWIGLEPYKSRQTPYSVILEKDEIDLGVKVSYEFCGTKPAIMATFEIKNLSGEKKNIEFYTHLDATLKTSHSYKKKDKAWTESDSSGSVIYINYDDSETGNAQIFVANAGEKPIGFTTDSESIGFPFSGKNRWKNENLPLQGDLISRNNPGKAAAIFEYRKALDPDGTLNVVQIIGSSAMDEGREIVDYLINNYPNEINDYKNFILDKVDDMGILETGDKSLDMTARWSKEILAVNAHYLDDEIVPMPCPAEYNFYFTHDALKTDLAAVNFDIERVKNDLLYIAEHANDDHIIPHAYYWKDDRYVTEYAGPDNWNHFWFVIVSAGYLRHSNDLNTLNNLYPLIEESIVQTLINKNDDDLMWAYRPDWWDIGRNFGARSYMTILAIRAIQDYIYISTVLDKNLNELLSLEKLTERMRDQLSSRLWDDRSNYLMNYYEDGTLDKHYYIGSLLAAHFGSIDQEKISLMAKSAGENLLDEKLGIYNAFPMDFHLLKDYLKFSGNEAGDPFIYMNGGIWPHGNAWYALALSAAGEADKSLDFIRNTMTINGIMNSPNGQPAMYEYRNSNHTDSSLYGKVDKPQFLWAGGWYLYSLYNLLGKSENSWNISFVPNSVKALSNSRYSIIIDGKQVVVDNDGSAEFIHSIHADGKIRPSAVVPVNMASVKNLKIRYGSPEAPYLASTNSILNRIAYDARLKELEIVLKAFDGHVNESVIISPFTPVKVQLNGQEDAVNYNPEMIGDTYKIRFGFEHHSGYDTLIVKF
ncbi:MAG: hypothetical protein AB7W47_13805 [Calditrichaceae bacterium]